MQLDASYALIFKINNKNFAVNMYYTSIQDFIRIFLKLYYRTVI